MQIKNYIKVCISAVLALTSITACSSTDSLLLEPDSINTPMVSEFNAYGQSTKSFAFSFKNKLADNDIKALEQKYNTKFSRVIPQIGVVVAERTEADMAQEDTVTAMRAESTVDNFEPINMVKLENVTAIASKSTEKQYHLDLVNVKKGWDYTSGKSKVKIALVDTGIDYNHPDLKDKIVGGKNIIEPLKKAMDDNGHGTHVAGIAAAETNNKSGISGIAPGCSLLAVKALKGGKGTDIDIAEGIVWAVDQGADVINVSIGLYTKSTPLERAVKYALSNNVVVVSSAGNEGKSSSIHLPSMIKGVIEVSATTKYDKFSSFSNFDQQISVSAPGDGILSTMPTYNVELTSEAGKNYGILSGTSMASPMVAGLAALLKSQNKSLTPNQIKAKIEASSVDLGKKGYDAYFGYGRIDILNTLKN